MKTSELCEIGMNSRQILRLVNDNVLAKVKVGAYQLAEQFIPDEVVIARLFPTAVIYLERARFITAIRIVLLLHISL